MPHHKECWEENGGCTTLGCRGSEEKVTSSESPNKQLEVDLEDPANGKARHPISERTGRFLIGLGTCMMVLLVVITFVLVRIAYFDGNGYGQSEAYDSALIDKLDADYYIDYENGTIPIGDLPIGARVVDPSWDWEFRTGQNYSGKGEVKPVTWIVVAKNHYSELSPHVTLLSEDLIGWLSFDNSTNRSHKHAKFGYNHWGDSGTANAKFGLRPWLNSSGIHSNEGFYSTFSDSFKQTILTTIVPNYKFETWETGSFYSTEDKVFIPSVTELGAKADRSTHKIGEAYLYFKREDNIDRVATIRGESWPYWTRSPVKGPWPDEVAYINVRYVSDKGDISAFTMSALFVDGNDRPVGVRPALNLKSDILVSVINH